MRSIVFLRTVLISAFALICGINNAYPQVNIDGIEYGISVPNLTATVYGCSNVLKDTIEIPSSISYEGRSFTVTKMSYYAMNSNPIVKVVKLPSTISELSENETNAWNEYGIFQCPFLTSIIVDPSNTEYGDDDGVLYNKRTGVLLRYPPARSKTSYIMPDNINYVYNYSFKNCTNLDSLILGSNLQKVKDNGICNTKLRYLRINSKLESIGYFYGNDSISEIYLEDSKKDLRISYHHNYDSSLLKNSDWFHCPISRIYMGRKVQVVTSYSDKYSPNYLNSDFLRYFEIGDSIFSVDNYMFTHTGKLPYNGIISDNSKPKDFLQHADTLVFGKNVNTIDVTFSANFKAIIVKMPQPITINAGTFTTETYLRATLFVPKGSKALYQNAYVWNAFNIEEFNVDSSEESIIINVNTTDGGSITINDEVINSAGGSAIVKKDEKIFVRFVPNDGCFLKEAFVNNENITDKLIDGAMYIIIEGPTTISAIFEEKPITLTIKYAENGNLKQIVQKGNSYTFLIEPNVGWKINTVLYNNKDVTNELDGEGSYTTPPILENAVLSVSFESTENSAVHSASFDNIRVYSAGNTINIQGLENGIPISIYCSDGKLVKKLYSISGITSIQLLDNQVYIVKVNNRAFKVGL